MMTFETWKEMTKEKPQHIPFLFLCICLIYVGWWPNSSPLSKIAWSHNVGDGSMPWEAASKDSAVCGTGWCDGMASHVRTEHEINMKQTQTLPFSLAVLIVVNVCLFSIIHEAFFDPFPGGNANFHTSIFGVLQALL